MEPSNLMRWAGLVAMLGGALGILLTPPFAYASFLAYARSATPPFWAPWTEAVFPLGFASEGHVYYTYGRAYFLTVLPELWGSTPCADCAVVGQVLSKHGPSESP